MAEERKYSVLLVDDEPDILFSLKGLLRLEFELFTAESGREALEILASRPIQVVMTDQRMPEMTGVELLGQVKLRYPDAIRIVFTGYADIKAVVEGINTGGLYRYITKPWDPDELIQLLHEAGARHEALIERRQLLIDLRDHLANCRRAGQNRPPDLSTRDVILHERLDRVLRDDAHSQ
jgi:response regulator RpfG family c-di-GMP phosphodiesterase